ncbi:MAG: Holliday junction branch migration protein RuvA [Lachnospiraceae bacterium]|nr:Holliday junction branch migration protein RuvA [Lachnospiraceae bacterium]
MYAYLIGHVTDYNVEGIVVEANQIGWNVKVSEETKNYLLTQKGEVKIYTYTYVKEDCLSLFGFISKEELELFKKMISVSGIGPKGALAILSALPFEDLVFAIISGDAKSISKAQGIGAKTAQRLILELKDKLSAESVSAIAAEAGDVSFTEQSAIKEAIEACVALGYSYQEAARALKDIKDDSLSTEEYVKLALKRLF